MGKLLRKSLATTQSKLGFILMIVIGTLLTDVTVASAQLPSGERQLGQTIIEPGYDDRTGRLIYIMTPIGPPNPTHANAHAVSPLFLIVCVLAGLLVPQLRAAGRAPALEGHLASATETG